MTATSRFRQTIPALLQLLLVFAALIAAAQLSSWDLDVNLRDVNMVYLGDHLRQTSDDLTRMARLNAITGDPLYREYFDEILAIRNGEMPRPEQYHDIPWWDIVLSTGERPTAGGAARPMREMLVENAGRQADLALLLEAEDQSNILTALENEVMDNVAAWREAGGGDYALEGAALENMLRLHGAEYHAGKERIMRPLLEFVDRGLQQARARGNDLVDLLGRNLIVVVAAAVLAILLGVWALLRRRGQPRQMLIVALQVLLLLLPLYQTAQLLELEPEMEEAREQGYVAIYADHLRQTSDDLTRMARLHAITGDPLYREYFDEILAIRNGETPRPQPYHEIPWWDIVLAGGGRPSPPGEVVSIRQLFEEHDITDEQLALLLESEDQSNALAALENEVMDKVDAYREAGGGDYALEGAALDNMLRLHGAEYHAAKELIMRPLAELNDVSWQQVWAYVQGRPKEVLEGFDLTVAALALAFLLGVGRLVTRQEDQPD